MIFTEDLQDHVLSRHETVADAAKLIVVSGYLGPDPIKRLGDLPIHADVVYGMYPVDGISKTFHDTLTGLDARIANVNIFYSTIAVHAKCYVWINRRREVVSALVGSANFSHNGLCTPHREILSEVAASSFRALGDYMDRVLGHTQSCRAGLSHIRRVVGRPPGAAAGSSTLCFMTLLDPRTGHPHRGAGLNWGHSTDAHVHLCDAYIPIRAQYVREYPELFPAKQLTTTVATVGGRVTRENDPIELIFDDGTTMTGLLEGSQTLEVDGIEGVYPKQISSFPHKRVLGEYFRRRLRVPDCAPVRLVDLTHYGRTDISVRLEAPGVYSVDFSAP